MEISAPLHHVVECVDLKESVNPVYQPRWELARVLLSPDLEVVKALEKTVQSTDYDTISVALVTLFRVYNRADQLLKYFVNKEIQETSEVATLFRGISLATKMVSAFCMQEGQAYCKNILDPSLKMFCIDEVSIEVDPTKLMPGEDLEINQVKLLGVCKGLLNHITRSVEHCSYPLRKMFEQTKQLVAKRFPEHHLRVVGGFYFLRFLCPALVCPEGFRLIPAPPAAKSRRSLILVSKILQNLANDVEFGEKESYMVSVNGFIKSNQTTMWSFLEQLSSPPKPRVAQTFVEMKQDPLAAIYQCIQSHREKLGAILIKSGQSQIFESLCAALDTYSTGSIKVRRASAAVHPSSLSSSSDTPSRKRSASALPTFSSPPPLSTPLSPTSTRVSELIPISSSPSQSLTNLLQLNLQHSSPVTNSPELSVRLQKLKQSSDRLTEKLAKLEKSEKIDENTNPKIELQNENPEIPAADSTKPPTSTTGSTQTSLPELEIELKKEMQEIQALKLALESGGMDLKERGETHQRFVGLLQHLKTMLATYKDLRRDKGDVATYNKDKDGEELATLVEEANLG